MDLLQRMRWAADDPKRLIHLHHPGEELKKNTLNFSRYRSTIFNSRFMRLDDKASYAAGLLANSVEMLHYLSSTAALPWPKMTIEIDQFAFRRATNPGMEPGTDPYLVWIVEEAGHPLRSTVSNFMEYKGNVMADPIAFSIDFTGQYYPSRENPVTQVLRPVLENYRQRRNAPPIPPNSDIIDLLILGQEYFKTEPSLGRKFARQLAPIPCRYSNFILWDHATVLDSWVPEITGAARQICSILALLSMDKSIIESTHKRGGSHIVKGRLTPYMATDTLTIYLHKFEKHITKYARESGRKHRRHIVRGHWIHTRKVGYAECLHEWADTSTGDKLRQDCKKCGSHRTWRKVYERGDASIGYVHHPDIKVTR